MEGVNEVREKTAKTRPPRRAAWLRVLLPFYKKVVFGSGYEFCSDRNFFRNYLTINV